MSKARKLQAQEKQMQQAAAAKQFAKAYALSQQHHETFIQHFQAERDKTMADLRATFEKKKAQQEILLAEVQQQLLQQQVDARQRELQLLAAHVLQRNAHLATLLKRMGEMLKKMAQEHGRLQPVAQLLKRLHSASHMQEMLELFDRELLQTNRSFLESLSEQYPTFTKTELKVCSLVLLKLSNKQMAVLLQSSPRTVETHRLHIARKVSLPGGQSLLQFLQQQQVVNT